MSVVSVPRRSPRAMLVAALVVAAALAAGLAGAQRAEAYEGTTAFCSGVYLNSNQNCYDTSRWLEQVVATFRASNYVRTCAGAKSTNLSSNVISFVCDNAGGGYAVTPIQAYRSVYGRATIHNGSRSPHDGFSGRSYWWY